LWGLLPAVGVLGVTTPPLAEAQERFPAVVTHVVDGDRVDARLADGQAISVQLIGIDAPETTPNECGGEQASDVLERLVEGRDVVLLTDPALDRVDRFGRSLFYVDRTDGLDAGEAMLRAGWAELFVDNGEFERLQLYREAQREARVTDSGVWFRCGGDFHRSRQDELRERRLTAANFMRRYYASISRRRFLIAWRMLGPRLQRKLGPYRQWRAGYRRSLGTSVRSARARLAGRRAVVAVSLRARDRDACSERIVRQTFRGRWILAPRRDSWVAVRVRMRKTGGGRVRFSKSECRQEAPPSSPQTPAPRPRNCQGYNPCLPPGPDVDCAGGSGDGPRYVDGPVSVRGDDPYELDRDGDGVACES
jgi:endonuclease YncB( thermonuclease family)